MDEINLYEKLCLKFCPYCKPVKKKDLACMGFLILERLLRKGNEIPFERFDKKMDIINKETLVQNMCIACPFYKDACDFIQQKEKSLPCGGFMLLGHLLKANIITIDNIKDMVFFKKRRGYG